MSVAGSALIQGHKIQGARHGAGRPVSGQLSVVRGEQQRAAAFAEARADKEGGLSQRLSAEPD